MDSPVETFPEGVRWYCLRTKRFSEPHCGGVLRSDFGFEVFCPMLRYEKARRSGKAWVTEALFPNYFFARFDFVEWGRRVCAVTGILKVVGFGGCPHPVPEDIITELQEAVTEQGTVIIPTTIKPGEPVQVLEGPFRGVRALVTRVLPAKERVAILLELLGTEREVEIPASAVLPDTKHPLA